MSSFWDQTDLFFIIKILSDCKKKIVAEDLYPIGRASCEY
jgi:hypothetical protein